ncbi:MAG TPA: ABC transporter substrate-binding protein [Thermodesulfobacteriota bacterium]|nr:ABC transporter substrate-binding protein [Thermodesulfobacteriota bacterium]
MFLIKRAYLYRWSFVLFLIIGIAVPALADGPEEEIRQTTNKILSIVTDPALINPSREEEKRRLVRKVVDERFDWEEMSRRSLARYWDQRTEEEKKEFVRLYSDLLERTYMDKVEGYSGEKVTYEGESVDNGYAMVKVKIVTKKNTDIHVRYGLKKKGNKWLVYDVSIEGVSLVNSYRTQFNRIILQSSYENLVKRLRERVELK